MRKLAKIFAYAVIISLTVAFSYNLLLNGLEKAINKLYGEKESVVDEMIFADTKEKGEILLSQCLENDEKIVIIGSSELSSPVPENPRALFPNNFYPHGAVFSGKGYVQNAINAVKIGALSDQYLGNDIVIIESLQWFTYDDILKAPFFANFSDLQFYDFMNNSKISDDNKKYLCERYLQLGVIDIYPYLERFSNGNKLAEWVNDTVFHTLEKSGVKLLSNQYTDPDICLMASTYISDTFINRIVKTILKPYWNIRYKYLLLKDRFDSYIWLRSLEPEPEFDNPEVLLNFDQMYLDGELEGRNLCTNNDIYVSDYYWDAYLRDRWEDLKDIDKESELMISGEWEDYLFFLRVCKDVGIKPYIVMMSVNGVYYDYTGFDRNKRHDLYSSVERFAGDYEFDCLNLEKYEYTPYYYCDVMHLGWKGWPNVLEEIVKYYS